jgi:uncharacterized membrane protein (UPF0182 family)
MMKSKQKIIILLLGLAVFLISFSQPFVHFLTESWWFDSLGFSQVFWTKVTWQAVTWGSIFGLYFLFLGSNYWIALRVTGDRPFQFFKGTQLEHHTQLLLNLIALTLIGLISLSVATAGLPNWEIVAKYFHGSRFDSADPVYQKNIGFYVFQLPFYESLHKGCLNLLVGGFVVATLVYIFKNKIHLYKSWKNFLTGSVNTHLSLLLAAITFLIALGFWLERFDLLFSTEGVVYGAGYTDIYARIIADWILTIIGLLISVSCLLSVWKNNFAFLIYSIGVYVIALIVINGVYPFLFQQFIVEPNELTKEKPYIERNIELTRKAYNLTQIKSQDFPAEANLSPQVLQNNQATIQNIRLWDYRPLLTTYRQLQEIRLYYHFNDVDIDRYTLNGNYRQVMLSARELDYNQVPARAQTWVNKRLKYTHGYGLVMSPVNQVTPDGLPELFIKNVPPDSTVDLTINQPAIYYGEKTDTYIFTGTKTPEFDYPLGDENAFTYYQGQGGIPLPSMWHRLAYAYDLGNFKIFLSNYFTNNSRIHYYRQVAKRVRHAAPFLRFDHDPYLVVVEGKLKWIVDAYTVSDRYPYSEPILESYNIQTLLNETEIEPIIQENINYIRNSVKVVVDAFDGTMQFIAMDENEPVLATYRKIFPQLFTDSQEISPALKAHFRYPHDLFTIQAQIYQSYHMSDPEVFYNQEDLWRFPQEQYDTQQQLMEPYYLIMSLPQVNQEEFILILPFTPANKDNMIAWMTARSDGENYGKLFLYEFPKQELIYGPSQIEARINQSPEISEQFTLWSRERTSIIRGSLLVIPIEQSLLYVEPIYLRSEQSELPELTRVIVAYDKEIVMAETLDQALANVFAEEIQSVPALQNPSPLNQSAWTLYQKAQDAARRGNWSEYGKYQQELEKQLQQTAQQKPQNQQSK